MFFARLADQYREMLIIDMHRLHIPYTVCRISSRTPYLLEFRLQTICVGIPPSPPWIRTLSPIPFLVPPMDALRSSSSSQSISTLAMNSFPTNNYTTHNDANHSSVPFTPRQFESRNEDSDAPTFFNHLLSNDLRDLGDFNVDARIVPTSRVSRGTPSRHVNPLFHRRLINVRRRRHVRPGAIPEGSPSQTAGFNAHPQANLLTAVAPELTVHPLDDAYSHNS